MKAYGSKAQMWNAAAAGEDQSPRWKTIRIRAYHQFRLEGMHSWLVYANQQFNAARAAQNFPQASSVHWKQRISPPPG